MSIGARTQLNKQPGQSLTHMPGLFAQRKSKPGRMEGECRRGRHPFQRKSLNNNELSEIPPIVYDALHSSGQPIDPQIREVMESRFGHDFGNVRVHTDTLAAESASAVNSLAYTVGRDVVFGKGHYSPKTIKGMKLFAHELTHVIQQDNARTTSSPINRRSIGASNCTAEQEADRIADIILHAETTHQMESSFPVTGIPNNELQRAVSSDMGKIRDNLTYSFLLDWVITDKEAHDVLIILKALNNADLKDTVAQMEKENLVDDLYENVSEEDQANEGDTLQRIHNFRIHKKTIKTGPKETTKTRVGSCSFDEKKEVDSKVGDTKKWARQSKEAVDKFLTDTTKHPYVQSLLDRHFFHQPKAGTLSQADQKSHAKDIRDNFEKSEQQKNPYMNVCASPFDQLCSALAAAYVSHSKKTVTYCPSFFRKSEHIQTYMLLHEFVHVYAGVDDKGYGDERIFAYLSPADAKNNADSYALFSMDIVKAPGGSFEARLKHVPKDDISDCSDTDSKEIRRSFAFASRMITEALNNIGSPRTTSTGTGKVKVEKHFKTSKRDELQRVIKRYKKIQEKIDESVNFECESDCDSGEIAYYISFFGTTSHICPAFFKLSSGKDREDKILLIVIKERLGMGEKAEPNTKAYQKETKDDSYDNPEAYVAYARDVS
jgi:hypothetical protein